MRSFPRNQELPNRHPNLNLNPKNNVLLIHMSDFPFDVPTIAPSNNVTGVEYAGETLTLTRADDSTLTTTIAAGGGDPVYALLNYNVAVTGHTSYTIDFNKSMMQRQSSFGDNTFLVTSAGGSDAPTLATQTDGESSGLQVNKDGLYRCTLGFLMLSPTTQNTSFTAEFSALQSVNGSGVPVADTLSCTRAHVFNPDIVNGLRRGSHTTYFRLEANNFVMIKGIYRNSSGTLNTAQMHTQTYFSVERVGD